jgi:peptidoglycan/xylan/chitin deacetylase (PgdA/CDA1 family)
VAYPIFRDHGVPVTVFLTTGFLDRSCWLWCDLVAHLFRQSPLSTVEIRIGASIARFSLASEAERRAAAFTVKEAAKRLDDEARSELVMRRLPSELRVSAPETPTMEYEPLTWDEVREMYASGIRFGAHTKTHPILSSIRSETRLSSEIAGSKQRIEEMLGHSIFHFAYPNGTLADVTPDVIRCVKRAGFSSAFLAEPGINRRSADRYTFRRNTAEPGTTVPLFGRNILRST